MNNLRVMSTKSNVSLKPADLNPPQKKLDGNNFPAIITSHINSQTRGKSNITSGQIGVDYNTNGKIERVNYYDSRGQLLTTSSFNAVDIIAGIKKFNISPEDIIGLADKLDQNSIGFRPYQLYAGTGSDHGIDLHNLAQNGLGTAYDWRKDANAQHKGGYSAAAQSVKTALANESLLILDPEVTTEDGLDANQFRSLRDKDGALRSFVTYSNGSASWHSTRGEAEREATRRPGNVLSLTL